MNSLVKANIKGVSSRKVTEQTPTAVKRGGCSKYISGQSCAAVHAVPLGRWFILTLFTLFILCFSWWMLVDPVWHFQCFTETRQSGLKNVKQPSIPKPIIGRRIICTSTCSFTFNVWTCQCLYPHYSMPQRTICIPNWVSRDHIPPIRTVHWNIDGVSSHTDCKAYGYLILVIDIHALCTI